MPSANSDPLLLAGKVLTIIMQMLMGIAGVVLLLVLIGVPALSLFGTDVVAEVATEFPDAGVFPMAVFIGLIAIALVLVAAAFVFFDKLRRIIDTVGEGDPFAPVNAQRLGHMAWLLLGLQLLILPATGLGLMLAKWADEVENANVTVDFAPDIEGILMVVVLFILARVFKHGAAMRDDLEGTV